MPKKKIIVDVENSNDSVKIENLYFNFKPITPGQQELEKNIKENIITFCKGPAGTGKTYVSCATALQLLKETPQIKKIYLVKSVSTLPDEEIGFLKGTLEEKMDPFMWSFIANFEKLIGEQNTKKLREQKIIEVKPIAYLRGVNIDNAITLVDESQNITVQNMRTILTRLGKNSKMIFLGDTLQIDIEKRNKSSLDFLFKNFKDIPTLGFTELTEEDIVRNPLIKKIEKKFREIDDLEKIEFYNKTNGGASHINNGGKNNGNGLKFSLFSKK